MQQKKIRIGIFASSPSLIESVQRVVADESDSILINTKGLDDAIPVAQEMARSGVETIISRRGTAYLLRESLRIPVLSFPHRSLDLLTSLKEASALGKTILLPVFRQELGNTGSLEKLLNIDLVQKIYEDRPSMQRIIIAGLKEGCEVVVGGDVTQQIAEKVGIKFVEIRTSDEDITATIEDAKSIAMSARAQKATAQRYRSIIDAASDGIIAVDEKGNITAINGQASSLLKLGEQEVMGRPITQLIDNIHISDVLTTQRPVYDQLTQVGKARYLISCQPIIMEGMVIGAVSTLRDFSRVMRSEQVVRRSLSKGHVAKYQLDSLIHESPAMHSILNLSRKYAGTDSTILIMGETGTGKEIFVHGMHNLSKRAKQPFVSINCAALPEQLLESELFGYEEGAFTGSKKGGKAGKFEIAHNGTIFLDEIDSTPDAMQTRLLRVLQEKEVMRVGGDRVIPVDVRVIAAAGRDLNIAVQEGKFRSDLFYRLNVLRLQIPPLRNRREDIPLLLDFFIRLFSDLHNLTPILIPEEYTQRLTAYSWPGNVRQLRNFAERLVMNCSLGNSQEALVALYHELVQHSPSNPTVEEETPRQLADESLKSRIKSQALDSERAMILEALEKCRFQKSKAADLLGISRTTLWRKVREYGIE